MCMGGANSESEDFVKSARRDVIDPFHIKMHFCIKYRCIGGIKISFTKKFFLGGGHISRGQRPLRGGGWCGAKLKLPRSICAKKRFINCSCCVALSMEKKFFLFRPPPPPPLNTALYPWMSYSVICMFPTGHEQQHACTHASESCIHNYCMHTIAVLINRVLSSDTTCTHFRKV